MSPGLYKYILNEHKEQQFVEHTNCCGPSWGFNTSLGEVESYLAAAPTTWLYVQSMQ